MWTRTQRYSAGPRIRAREILTVTGGQPGLGGRWPRRRRKTWYYGGKILPPARDGPSVPSAAFPAVPPEPSALRTGDSVAVPPSPLRVQPPVVGGFANGRRSRLIRSGFATAPGSAGQLIEKRQHRCATAWLTRPARRRAGEPGEMARGAPGAARHLVPCAGWSAGLHATPLAAATSSPKGLQAIASPATTGDSNRQRLGNPSTQCADEKGEA